MKGIIGSFVLLTAISMTPRQPNNQTENALKALGKATYIQTGMNTYVKKLEKQYIPKELREYGAWATTVTKALIEKKVTYEWTF